MPAKYKILITVLLVLFVIISFVSSAVLYFAYAGECSVNLVKKGDRNLILCGLYESNGSGSSHTFIGRIEKIEEKNNKIYLLVNLNKFHERFYLGERNIGKLYVFKSFFSGVQELGDQIPLTIPLNSAQELEAKIKGKYIKFNVSSSGDKQSMLLLIEKLKNLSNDANATSIIIRETEYWNNCTEELDTIVESLTQVSFGNYLQRVYRLFFNNGDNCTPFVSSLHMYE